MAPQLSSPKDLQLSTDSFLRCHVVAPTTWTHVDKGLRELIDAGGALLVIAEGGHKAFSVQAVPAKQAVRGWSPAVVA
jgi:tartrate dehydratase beta subunit/fumarate hydratase class I family protein